MDKFQPVERTLLPNKVAGVIMGRVRSGQLRPGDRLPPERELAQQMHVSRATLREALKVLRLFEIIDAVPNQGTVVKAPRQAVRDQWLAIAGHIDDEDPVEVLEVREALEAQAARLAAQRRTDEDLATLHQSLEALRAQVTAGLDSTQADIAFHHKLVRCAHNRLLLVSMAAVLRAMTGPIWQTLMSSLAGEPDDEVMRDYIEQHAAIDRAVAQLDADAAEAAVRAHLRITLDRLTRWDPPDARSEEEHA